jgi:hypothetical protein
VTSDEQAELKRELAALDGLLSKLMPEDDLARLALDPKRQQAAAQMVGTVTLAKDLLTRMRKRIEVNGAVVTQKNTGRGMPREQSRGRSGAFILRRLERASEPIQRNVLANEAVKAGYATVPTTVYGVFHRLIEDGRIKLDESNNTISLVR